MDETVAEEELDGFRDGGETGRDGGRGFLTGATKGMARVRIGDYARCTVERDEEEGEEGGGNESNEEIRDDDGWIGF